MTVIIKEWKAMQINSEARRFNTFCDVEYDERHIAIDNKYVNVIVLKETEKAYQFLFSTGRVVGSMKGWKAWCPKSAVESMEDI